jgi:UTP--glucose-1-phosphate uridylyltransferase
MMIRLDGAVPCVGFSTMPVIGQLLPTQGTAPSNLIIMGRYILQPEIFDILKNQQRGAGGEIQLTDAMCSLLKRQNFHAVKFDGISFDCGSHVGFLTANMAFALANPAIRNEYAREIRKLMEDLSRNGWEQLARPRKS